MKAIRKAAQTIAAGHITERGVPADVIYGRCALGSVQVQAELAKLGVHLSRGTIISRLGDIYGSPVGQMPAQRPVDADARTFDFDTATPWRLTLKEVPYGWRGAYLYDLRRDHTDAGRQVLVRLWRLARNSDTRTSRASRNSPTSFHGSHLRLKRVAGLLDSAMRHAEGHRNEVGNWLAKRCREVGLDPGEVEKVVTDYQRAVEWFGTHRYTLGEALATVRSVFRKG
jgi:hypothetical protein